MAGPVERVMAERVAADPVTAALAEVVGVVVREVLTEHLPKLTVTQQEAARMLSVSTKTVGEFVAEGRLHRVGDRPACPITLASVLAAAGWPMTPAPVAAPLVGVPA